MKFSYSAVWAETVALLRAHAPLVLTIAAVFVLLPTLAVAYLIPQPEAEDFTQLISLYEEYWRANWHWMLLETLAQMVGTLAILELVYSRGLTVGAAIAAGILLLPLYFLAGFLSGVAIGLGFLLFIVPGLYLIGRLTPLGPVMVAERRRNPIDAIGRTFALTKGHGWAIFGFVLIVAVAAIVVALVVNMVLGGIFYLVAGQDLGRLLALIVGSATSAAAVTLFVLLYAAVYNQLAAGAPAAPGAAASGT